MRLLTYKLEPKGAEYIGVMCKMAGRDFYPIIQFGLQFTDMNDLISNITREELDMLEQESGTGNHQALCYDSTIHCAPIPRPKQDIICLGINFLDHREESGRFKKEIFEKDRSDAIYFAKRVSEAVPDGGEIPSHPGLVDSLDYEAELAVIIGKDARNVSKEDAFDYVFGYTILNDISARNVQKRHSQWFLGKSLEGFAPMGPFIRTANDIPKPPVLTIKSRVNGELRQNSSTDLLIFDIPHVIEELSFGMLLKAGTIISMGTPGGVGMGFVPPKYLRPNDVVECRIQEIGTITNTVR